MKRIIIKPKIIIKKNLNLKNLNLINKKNMSLKEIKKIKILYDNKEKILSELFFITEKITRKSINEILIYKTNVFFDYLGYEWSNDYLEVNSDVGSYLGAKMKSGSIVVKGSCENYSGAEMSGGSIFIKKNAGKFVGASINGKRTGMNGGTIFISGNTDEFLSYQMRRGLVFVEGMAGDNCCNNLIAGTVIIKKGIGRNFGIGMKRGTIILLSNIKLESNFVEGGECSTSFISILNKFILEKFDKKMIGRNSSISRFIGDKFIKGKGELLKIS